MTVEESGAAVRDRSDDNRAGPGRPGVLDRAVVLLELVAEHEGGVGVREAARLTGIDRSAVSRILAQLEELGWVEQTGERGVYSTGHRLFSLVAVLRDRDSLSNAAKPIMQELVDTYNESCYLAVRQHHRLVFRDKIDCDQTIRYVLELGKPFRLTTGSAGAAILAGMPQSEVELVFAEGLERYTPSSITDIGEYRETLKRDRELGYSVSHGRWIRNGAGIAAPFFDASGSCAGAVTLSLPGYRLDLLPIDKVGHAVADGARRLSRRLGYLG
ncbi:IclR family transcriptional regulator [Kibdelosporangium philippinense]|uniref:IclR family transcriptional regulator n=1 Tax=Kibdelosporangium philippinense TaxID=211113 RepID=A0ABS8Z244_9PSEU|nr:IclR family transcriptional regulator [Kibdelosporangium philippinense]MCE7002014.1 IclR family transcriptional regulator [Kibdelosporangium philippinense]